MPNFNGNITLTSVEKNEVITVKDGSLTVLGDVGSGAKIILENSQQNSIGQIRVGISLSIINNLSIRGSGHKLIIQGNVHSQVKITASSDIEFQGYLSDKVTVTTYNGNIIAKDIGENVTLTTHNGNITTGNVGFSSSVKSQNGTVSVGNVSANSVVKSHNGDVKAISYDPSAKIKTHNGKRYINGARTIIRRENTTFASSISSFDMSGLTHFFSSGVPINVINSRVFINGVEQRSAPERRTGPSGNTRQVSADINSGNSIPASLQAYINSFEGKESFQDAFNRLNITIGEGLSCNISLNIPNIPVLLRGQLYDWEFLKKLPIDSNNKYTDPMTRENFTLVDIMPGRAICTILESQIKDAEQKNVSSFKR